MPITYTGSMVISKIGFTNTPRIGFITSITHNEETVYDNFLIKFTDGFIWEIPMDIDELIKNKLYIVSTI